LSNPAFAPNFKVHILLRQLGGLGEVWTVAGQRGALFWQPFRPAVPGGLILQSWREIGCVSISKALI